MAIWNFFTGASAFCDFGDCGVLAAGRLDSALATLLSSLAVLPFAARMYREDRRESGALPERK